MSRTVLVAGVVCGLAGAALVHAHVQQMEEHILGGDLVAVAILTKDLKPGSELTAAALGATDLPERYVESRHVLYDQRDRALGMHVGLAGKAGETLLWTDLAGMQREARTLSQLVPSGMRAMPIRVTGSALGRLARPGDTVDVLHTGASASANVARRTTTLMQDVLVLAVGSDIGQRDGSKSRSGEVTLSVTPAQARVLASLDRNGSLHIALRNPDDLITEDEEANILSPRRGGSHEQQ